MVHDIVHDARRLRLSPLPAVRGTGIAPRRVVGIRKLAILVEQVVDVCTDDRRPGDVIARGRIDDPVVAARRVPPESLCARLRRHAQPNARFTAIDARYRVRRSAPRFRVSPLASRDVASGRTSVEPTPYGRAHGRDPSSRTFARPTFCAI
ncbi:hypothetical protein F3J14_33930 [Burkholderia sp. Tr-862]|uniref:hypothetical protein n=1 Tax=Burkholderia sp. Tr-862 TaxID=2608331 RepID=UPI0014196FB8|nr:hypothetical protein [Burkholderia sp. Tr-862]NIF45755.1 hypothetical protein [Burkholderia sp. Tr-862]